jgi:hypothetical protein
LTHKIIYPIATFFGAFAQNEGHRSTIGWNFAAINILIQNHVIQVQVLQQKGRFFARLEAAHSEQKELQRCMGG